MGAMMLMMQIGKRTPAPYSTLLSWLNSSKPLILPCHTRGISTKILFVAWLDMSGSRNRPRDAGYGSLQTVYYVKSYLFGRGPSWCILSMSIQTRLGIVIPFEDHMSKNKLRTSQTSTAISGWFPYLSSQSTHKSAIPGRLGINGSVSSMSITGSCRYRYNAIVMMRI